MDGELEQCNGRWQLRFTRRLPHPPATVWRALTEPAQLAAWFPSAIEGERVAGAPLRFVFGNGVGPSIDGRMLICEPPSLLEFSWGEGELLRFELRAEGEGALLIFTNVFDDIGKSARDAAGWHACLDLLALRLDGEAAPWAPRERWSQVHKGYVERFPAEASTIGPPPAPTS